MVVAFESDLSLVSVWRVGYCPSPLPDEATILMSQGLGSTFFDGRWHHKIARQVVYAGSSRALCQLEKRVQTNGIALKSQILMRLDLPEDAVLLDVVDFGLTPDRASDVAFTRSIGDAWLLNGSSLGLWVPSVVEPLERNPFEFDPRLF